MNCTNRIIPFVLLAILSIKTTALGERPEFFQQDSEFPGPFALEPAVSFPAEGIWISARDNKIDGKVDGKESHRIVLHAARGELIGRHAEDKANSKRRASVFAGKLTYGSPPLITLKQTDPVGSTTFYTARQVAPHKFLGHYMDNRGKSGDWSLTHDPKGIVVPLTDARLNLKPLRVPSGPLLESVLGIYGQAIRRKRLAFVNLRPPNRNLWTKEIEKKLAPTVSYEEVDYIGTAMLVVPKTGDYTVDIPKSGTQLRFNGILIKPGDIKLAKGAYEIELYANHWGQPYLKYAHASVFEKGTDVRVPFVNTASEVKEFLAQKINKRKVTQVSEYSSRPWKPGKVD